MKAITKTGLGLLLFVLMINLQAQPAVRTVIFYNKTPTDILNNTSTNTTSFYNMIGDSYNRSISGDIYQGDTLSFSSILAGFMDLKDSIGVATSIIHDTSVNYIDPLLPGFSNFIGSSFSNIIIFLGTISLMLVFFGRPEV